VIALLMAVRAVIKFSLVTDMPPLGLSKTAANTPVGPLDGSWDVAAGSLAGFRIQESAMGMSNDVVGRTNAVAGNIAVSGRLSPDFTSGGTITTTAPGQLALHGDP
jgi:hypothetical protein